MTNSFKPSAANSLASARTCSIGFVACLPRIFGIAQNVQVRSHPSEIFRYAMCRGVTRIRLPSSRAVAGAGLNTVRCSPRLPTSRSAARATSSRENTPITASTPGRSSNSVSFWRSARQPATIIPRVPPACLSPTISSITPYDSARDESINAQVLIMTRSDPSGSATNCQPSSLNRPSIRSLSTRFFGQPRLTNENVPRQFAGSTGST